MQKEQPSNLNEWLEWQQTLHPKNIDFKLERIKSVYKKLNIKKLSIETGAGKFFDPARKLFRKCNFEPCKPFAHYKEDVNSIYLTKLISND